MGLSRGERLHLGPQRRECVDTLALDGVDLRLGLRERLADRPYQALDGGLALLERAGRVRLLARQALPGELQEQLVVALQAVARELAERALHPGLQVREVPLTRLRRCPVGLDLRAHLLELDPQRLLAPGAPQ